MSRNVTLVYAIGDEVSFRHAPDIKATVTAACIRQNDYTTYEVTWMHNGEVKKEWLTTSDLDEAEAKKPLGFKS